jgi:two-component system chemotaxis response regulator CheB
VFAGGVGAGTSRRMTSSQPAGQRDLVVVGGSAGGVDALKRFVALLPPDLPAAVCVTLHLASGSPSMLPGILARVSAIKVQPAEDGAQLEDGVVYVAQPDAHLVVVDDHLVLGQGARENGNRPSVDVLLRSAAVARGSRVVGVVLTGMLDDGAAGLAAVARYGGAALVQDPEDAEFPSMPRNALRGTPTARALPLAALADEVVRIVSSDEGTTPEVEPQQRERDLAEVQSALGLDPLMPDGSHIAPPSRYSCPECGGVLNEVGVDPALRFRCRVGHAYTAGTLLQHQAGTVEDALWTALRALEERQEISQRLAEEAGAAGRDWSRMHFRRRADDARRSADVLRRVLDEQQAAGSGDEDPLTAGSP